MVKKRRGNKVEGPESVLELAVLYELTLEIPCGPELRLTCVVPSRPRHLEMLLTRKDFATAQQRGVVRVHS